MSSMLDRFRGSVQNQFSNAPSYRNPATGANAQEAQRILARKQAMARARAGRGMPANQPDWARGSASWGRGGYQRPFEPGIDPMQARAALARALGGFDSGANASYLNMTGAPRGQFMWPR